VITGSVLVSGALWVLALVLGPSTPLWAVLIAHVTLCIGLALTFTPLSTASLSSLKPRLYAHGSALSNTLQQVMAAAGTALFVTLLSTGAAAGLASGADEVDATAAGVQTAFFAGAIISALAILASVFIRTPAVEEDD
jgi:DHA2 family lincomycin resistance protein-like MFS transporter